MNHHPFMLLRCLILLVVNVSSQQFSGAYKKETNVPKLRIPRRPTLKVDNPFEAPASNQPYMHYNNEPDTPTDDPHWAATTSVISAMKTARTSTSTTSTPPLEVESVYKSGDHVVVVGIVQQSELDKQDADCRLVVGIGPDESIFEQADDACARVIPCSPERLGEQVSLRFPWSCKHDTYEDEYIVPVLVGMDGHKTLHLLSLVKSSQQYGTKVEASSVVFKDNDVALRPEFFTSVKSTNSQEIELAVAVNREYSIQQVSSSYLDTSCAHKIRIHTKMSATDSGSIVLVRIVPQHLKVLAQKDKCALFRSCTSNDRVELDLGLVVAPTASMGGRTHRPAQLSSVPRTFPIHISFALRKSDMDGCASLLQQVRTEHTTTSNPLDSRLVSWIAIFSVVGLLVIVIMCRKYTECNNQPTPTAKDREQGVPLFGSPPG